MIALIWTRATLRTQLGDVGRRRIVRTCQPLA